MSIESACAFCGTNDANHCQTKKEAKDCDFFNELPTDKVADSNKPTVVLDDDFGFTFVDDQENIEEIKSIKEEIDVIEVRLNRLYNAVIPFLDNLCKNPEKTTISWPNRVEKITEYKKKLKLIKEGKLDE